ncbi:YecA family protein (plasmid) [Paracoccus liaowanqingii]|uniref:YecA family protein n=1 Tax=Paracoccus liaowanqingii TaxID=2560053 RepID=A0A4Y5SQP1_9RHOB|nr:UPF0149 family protein [Paracoccus liaowanqingii]QDA35801.1 YecA family protein [Paracoccus liaowanqingii]
MLPSSVTTMITALAQNTNPKVQAEKLTAFGRALLRVPADAADLLGALASISTVEDVEERMSHLLGAALDEARMARENGRQQGKLFIDSLETHLSMLVVTGILTFRGRLAVSRAWVLAGLTPPESLALQEVAFNEVVRESQDPADFGSLLDSLVGPLIQEDGGSSALYSMFAEMFPTMAPGAREALVRVVVGRPPEIYAELGCGWLLDASAEIRSGAVEGLFNRLASGQLSAEVLARLTILRSWLTDAVVRDRLDGLVRDAMRKGIASAISKPKRKLHRVVASLVDGSGTQSMAATVQTGSSRSVALVLLKQGFGVKDAYVLPCASATEQRAIMARITDEIEAFDVSPKYMAQAIGLAVAEGLEAGLAPVPGLVDVVQSCSLVGLRPLSASVEAILGLADPDGRIAGLPVQARGRLITASQYWVDQYPMLAIWFEDSDETVAGLESAKSHTALTRSMWSVLEARRAHWAAVIARNALLLSAIGADDADTFIAVASALMHGRDLKKIPVMKFICDQSIIVWIDRGNGQGGLFGPDLEGPFVSSSVAPAFAAEKKGELARLLRPAGLTEPWLDGYLMGVCTAPLSVAPPDWLSPLLDLVAANLKTDKKLSRFVELLMLHYNGTVSKMQAGGDAALIPTEIPLIPIWADGYLTAWEATKPNWPTKALGSQGKSIRKVLERATDGRFDHLELSVSLPAWLRQRFANKQM